MISTDDNETNDRPGFSSTASRPQHPHEVVVSSPGRDRILAELREKARWWTQLEELNTAT